MSSERFMDDLNTELPPAPIVPTEPGVGKPPLSHSRLLRDRLIRPDQTSNSPEKRQPEMVKVFDVATGKEYEFPRIAGGALNPPGGDAISRRLQQRDEARRAADSTPPADPTPEPAPTTLPSGEPPPPAPDASIPNLADAFAEALRRQGVGPIDYDAFARAAVDAFRREGMGAPPSPDAAPVRDPDTGEPPEVDPRIEQIQGILGDLTLADPRDYNELFSSLLTNPQLIQSAVTLELPDDMQWEVGYIDNPPYGPTPIKIPRRAEDKIAYVREALALNEEKGAEHDMNTKNKISKATQLLQAIIHDRYKRRQRERADEGDVNASENLRWAERLPHEYQSREELKQAYFKFEASDSVKTNAGIVRGIFGVTLQTLIHTPEIAQAFNLLEERFDQYLFTNLGALNQVRDVLTEELARRLVRPDLNPEYTRYSDSYDAALANPRESYNWAITVAERLWHLWGNAAMHDKLRPKEVWEEYSTADPEVNLPVGSLTFASNYMPNGSSYDRRLFQIQNYVLSVKEQLGAHPDLIKGLDLNGGDFITKGLREVFQNKCEEEYKVRFLRENGQNPLSPDSDWRVAAEQYAVLMAKREVELTFGIPIEVKDSKDGILIGGDEEVVDVRVRMRNGRPDIYTNNRDPKDSQNGNAIAEVVVRKKIKRPGGYKPAGLLLPEGGDDVYDYDYAKGGEYDPGRDETRALNARISGTNWIPRRIKGAPDQMYGVVDYNDSYYAGVANPPSFDAPDRQRYTVTTYYDYSRLKWDKVDFKTLFEVATPMYNWSFDGLEYGDEYRSKLVGPSDPSLFVRKPRIDTLWSFAAMNKHKNNWKNGEAMVLDLVEYLAGPVFVEEGEMALTERELLLVVDQAAGRVSGAEGEDSQNKVPMFNPLELDRVREIARERIAKGRSRMDAFIREQRALPPEKRAKNPMMDSTQRTSVTGNFARGFALDFFLNLIGLGRN